MTDAIIFVPEGEFDPHANRCLAYCERRGYHLTGIVRGDFNSIIDLMCTRGVQVVIVSTSEHLPPNRQPRIETVTQEVTLKSSRNQRRTQIIRRGGAR